MTLADVVRWLEQAPGDTLLPARSMLEMLRGATPTVDAPASREQSPTTWRERLWTVPDETRIGVAELAEALGRPASWVYRHTSARSGLELLPYRKLDGELCFVVREIRAWLEQHEETVTTPPPVVRITRGRKRA